MGNPSGHLAYTAAERITIIGSCMLGFALDLYDVLILPFLMPAIQHSLNLSLTQIASITSITLIGSVIGGAAFGVTGDRLGRKTALQLTLLLFALGSIASAFAWNYTSLASLRLLTGIGLGGEWGAGMVLFNEAWNPKRRGLGSAFIQGSAVLASAGASIVAIWALGHFAADRGWRVGLLTGSAPLALIIVIRFWMPESKAWLRHDQDRRAGRLPALGLAARMPLAGMFRPGLRRISFIALGWMAAYMFCYYGVIVFMPTLMLKTLHTPADIVRTTSVIVSVAGGCSYIAMGWLNDRHGRRMGTLVPAALWIASLLGLYFLGNIRYDMNLFAWPIFWLFILFGMGNTSLGVVGTWLSELYPIEVRSTAVSSIYMAGRAAGSLAPVGVPAFAAAFGGGDIIVGFYLCLPAAVLFIFFSCILPETRRGGRATAAAATSDDIDAPDAMAMRPGASTVAQH